MIAPRFADITPYGLPPLPLSTIVASPRRRMAMIVGLIVALVIVGWFLVHMITAYMQRTPLGVPVDKPMAVTLLEDPTMLDPDQQMAEAQAAAAAEQAAADQATAAAAAAPPPQPEVAPAAPATQDTTATTTAEPVPYDPSFNPFAQKTDETVEQPAAPPQAPAPPIQPVKEPSASDHGIDDVSVGPNATPRNFGAPGGSLPGLGPPGTPGGLEATRHPQYLQVKLDGYVPAAFSGQLHAFLIRLISCGVHPVTANNPDLAVEADVTFGVNGVVTSARLTNVGAFPDDPVYPMASARLMKALSNPSCSFMTLPPLTYASWRSVHVSFYQHY